MRRVCGLLCACDLIKDPKSKSKTFININVYESSLTTLHCSESPFYLRSDLIESMIKVNRPWKLGNTSVSLADPGQHNNYAPVVIHLNEESQEK